MDQREILLVEDNPDDVALTLRAFRKTNILNKVQIACDGVEALDYLFGSGQHAGRDTSQQPAIILLDLKLPRIDGLEVLKAIREDARTRLIRVIVLTSSNEDHDVMRAYDIGANSYIRKPVDFDQFIQAVGQLGLYWLLLNESAPVQIESS